MPASLLTWARRINAWANRHEMILLFWTLILFLRAPNLAEPYWYGDEGIYLTIGTALRHGAVLYRDIVDHKTPLIYFLAMTPSQFWFRILLILWTLVSTSFFFMLAKRWLKRWAALLSTLIFVIFSTLPWLEGHIPNGELFVTGFLLAGIWLAARSGWWKFLEQPLEFKPRWQISSLLGVMAAGGLISLGMLTKVPAILDAGAVGATLFYALAAVSPRSSWRARLQWLLIGGITLTVGIVLPILFSLLYYWLRGAGAEYIQFGLLYNFHYSGNWNLPFSHPALLFLFSLPGKTLVLITLFLLTLLSAWRQPKQALSAWVAFWLAAALFGSLLSNRPYPHYLLQVVPPAALAIGFLLEKVTSWWNRALIATGLLLLVGATTLLGFGFYEVKPYYQNAWNLLRGHESASTYRHRFNHLVEQNETLVPDIQTFVPNDQPIFIWGTNPMLYAQSQRVPATRFTVAFHIHDLKNYDEMFAQITQKQPKVIVVMKNEAVWPDLWRLLETEYFPVVETADMTLYHRRMQPVTWLLQ